MVDDLKQSPGISFLSRTRLGRATIHRLQRPDYGEVPAYKSYPDARKITLPRTSWQLSEARILNLLQRRRSTRHYAAEPVSLAELAFMLWAAQGITAQAGRQLLRTAPSAGALYPVETYVSMHRVAGQESGLYHLDVRSFQLELVTPGNQGSRLAKAFLDQSFIEQAGVCLIWSAIARRSLSKYGDRGVRYLLLDTAHICQNVLLGAEAVGCGGCPVAAFYDDEVNLLLGIDGIEETALYGAAIGKSL